MQKVVGSNPATNALEENSIKPVFYNQMKNGKYIDPRGTQRWYKVGYFHREDGPAIIYADGTQYWCKKNYYHRDGGPSIIYSNGEMRWHRETRLHRENGPAVIWPDGRKQYWIYGERIK